MKKLVLGILVSTLFGTTTIFAASGIFGAFIEINDGSGGTWYASNTDPDAQIVSDFHGSSFTPNGLGGSFTSSDTLEISDANILTYKNGGSNVNGTQLNYRLYETGSPSGSFTSLGINFGDNAPFNAKADGEAYANGGDQQWDVLTGGSINLLSGLSTTDNYTLEVYWSATTDSDGTHFVNDGGSNFTATFNFDAPAPSAIPEPGTMAMLGVASSIIYAVRRKRVIA